MQKEIYKNTIIKLLAIFFTILNIDNINIFNEIRIIPNIDLMLIYFFTILNIGIFPIWFIFLLGIWSDSLTGIPIGISSLIYIILIKIFLFVNYPDEKNINLKKNIVVFFTFLTMIYILRIGFLSIYNYQIYNIKNLIIELFISMVIYVIIQPLLYKIKFDNRF